VAAVSVQGCERDSWQGFVLVDVTRPAQPVELARVPLSPRGTHEIWLAQARGR